MRFDLISRFFQAFSPQKYRVLSAETTKTIAKRTLVLLCWLFLIMLIIGLPKLLAIPSHIQEGLASFDTFTISTNISQSSAWVMLDHPRMVIDLNKPATSGIALHINQSVILYQGMFSSYERPWTTLDDVVAAQSTYKTFLTSLLFFLVPSLVVLLFILFLLEGLVAFGIAYLIGFIIVRGFGYRITLKATTKIALIGLGPLFFLHVVPFVWFRWWLIPFSLYILLVVLAMIMVGEYRYEHRRKKSN